MKFVGKALEIIQTLRDKKLQQGSAAPLKRSVGSDRQANSLDTYSEPDLEATDPAVAADLAADAQTPQGADRQQTAQADANLSEPFLEDNEDSGSNHDDWLQEALSAGLERSKDAMRLSDALLTFLQTLLPELPVVAAAQIKITNARIVREPNFPTTAVQRQQSTPSYYRWRAANADLCLSVRAAEGTGVELFIMQADEIALLSYSEFGSRRKARFEQARTAGGYVWMLNKVPAQADKIKELMRSCLMELSGQKEPEDENAQFKVTERMPVVDPVQQLLLEKENLIFKVLNQQETIKNELARSLHDTVLADLLMLKRHMRGDQELSKDDIIETIDEISQQLRDICNECAPRNLHDWGLKVSIQDLLNRFGQRTAIDTALQCDVDIPNLPAVVELHIFRLIQESLNNIEKHARASQVSIFIESLNQHCLRFRVVDNGQGFDSSAAPRATESGGMGLTGMRERTQLIRCFYPTEFAITSDPGNGTTVSLQLTVQN